MGQAGDPGISGSERGTGGDIRAIVLDDLITTVRPVACGTMSPLVRVCGPDHRDMVGDSRFDARRNEKKPIVRAAFIGAAYGIKSRYCETSSRSRVVKAGAGVGVWGRVVRAPL